MIYAKLFLLGAGLDVLLAVLGHGLDGVGTQHLPHVHLTSLLIRQASGPFVLGALSAALGYAVEPFTVAATLYAAPVILALGSGVSGSLALPLLALSAGFMVRAWSVERFYGFLGGVAAGFAVWLTLHSVPFVLMLMAALLLRWVRGSFGLVIIYLAAGFVDVLGFALAINRPPGGYMVADIHRMSIVYVALAVLMLAAAAANYVLERRAVRHWRWLGVAVMVGAVAVWFATFPRVLGAAGIGLHPSFVLPGAWAVLAALWLGRAQRGRWLCLYMAGCAAVVVLLGSLFTGIDEAAALAPLVLGRIGLNVRPYGVAMRPPGSGAGTPVVPGSDRGKP